MKGTRFSPSPLVFSCQLPLH